MTLLSLQTNIPFIINVLKEDEFLDGAVRTDFILHRPQLFKVEWGQNRAQKLLQYLGNVMINGPCTPLATTLKPSKDAPEAPEVCIALTRYVPSCTLKQIQLKFSKVPL